MSDQFQKCPNVAKTIARVASDPFSEGVTHGGLHPSSISKIVENLFWSGDKNFDNVTIEIKKEIDDHHISVKVVERGH